MQPEISEFSYGFAVISEIIEKYSLKGFGAPEFPTQYKEGQTGGGWDAKLPAVEVFIQIKRSEIMTTKLAGQAKCFPDFPYFPYYRAPIYRKSKQHELLLTLESEDNLVYYIAPAFSMAIELNRHFTNSEIAENSIFVSPKEIGHIRDKKQHWIAFQKQPTELVYLCSEPKKISSVHPDLIFKETLPEKLSKHGRTPDEEFFHLIGDKIMNVAERVEEESSSLWQPEEEDTILSPRFLLGYREATRTPEDLPTPISKLVSDTYKKGNITSPFDRRDDLIDYAETIRKKASPSHFAFLASRLLLDSELLIYQPT